ncbi:endonuclease/exonuclease/phosphatase family protein [Nocardia sp. NPDC052566]|uniref:endonuclease/exonuclease/phosphatase family protein n=1 Tax=Nocardia sp. NPDC052566 TaxID=3364330 RepID=UPI0037C54678
MTMTGSMTRRTAVKAFGAAAGLLAAGVSMPLAGAAPSKEIRVLALNTWLSGSKISGGIDLIADLIIDTQSTIVLLSEAGNATTPVAAALEKKGHRFNAVPSHDTGVLSAFPIEDSADLGFLVKARVNVEGRKLTVYAAHLEYRWYATYLPRGYGAGVPAPGEFSEYGWKKMPAPVTDPAVVQRVNITSGRPDVIGKFIEDAKGEAAAGRSVIMGGDFNEPSTLDWTGATRHLFDHNGVVLPWESTQRLQNAGFVDAYRSKYPNPVTHPGFTWPASNPDAKVAELTWAPDADERDRIDYIFAGPGSALSLSEVGLVGPRGSIVRNARQDENTQDNFVASPKKWVTDHKAVLATYQLGDGTGRPPTGSSGN